MSLDQRSEILLETGTNELMVLEFVISGNSYGINVAKVRDLRQAEPVQPMPRSQAFIEGIFQPRDEVYTLIDLPSYLNLPPSEDASKDIFIVTTFNGISNSFRVHSVENIHRISWTAIEKPSSTIYGGEEGIVTGIAKVEGRIISIIDFEKILYDISPETSIRVEDVADYAGRSRIDLPILVAEDSEFLRRILLESLHTAGYQQVTVCDNGQEAWATLEEYAGNGRAMGDQVALVITDIEMPQMDGHRLTRLIKEDPRFAHLPVVIFSSLINDSTYQKGLSIGADAQITKPQIHDLVGVLDTLLNAVPSDEDEQDV